MKKIIFRKIAIDCAKFFLLTIFTFSTIIWVLQAVNYLDFVIEDGHGFMVYFKYTLLSFPKIFSRIYPYALFLSFTYILLKYENNNELVIFWNFGIYKIRFKQENDILSALASGKSIDFKVFFKNKMGS